MRSTQPNLDRRQLLSWAGNGLAGTALAGLLMRDGVVRAEGVGVPGPHFTPRVKRAIHICCLGAVSQVDSFDYKPGLIQRQGKSLESREKPDVFFG